LNDVEIGDAKGFGFFDWVFESLRSGENLAGAWPSRHEGGTIFVSKDDSVIGEIHRNLNGVWYIPNSPWMRVPSPSNLRSGGDLTQPGFEHVENSGAYSIYIFLDSSIYLTGVVELNSLVVHFSVLVDRPWIGYSLPHNPAESRENRIAPRAR
jgi:hypothetical protein